MQLYGDDDGAVDSQLNPRTGAPYLKQESVSCLHHPSPSPSSSPSTTHSLGSLLQLLLQVTVQLLQVP